MVANEPYSGIENNISSFVDVEKSTINAINRAHNYIWNLHNFPFKNSYLDFKTVAGQSSYEACLGNILNIKLDNANLKLINDPDNFAFEIGLGKPQSFYLDFTTDNRKIVLYKTPDNSYDVRVKFETFMSIKGLDGSLKQSFELKDDKLNLPPEIEPLYLNCLTAKSVCYLLNDVSDENYAPYDKAFTDAYQNLINLSGVKTNTLIII